MSKASGEVPPWATVPLAICLAAIVGWLDFHATEVQGTVLVIIVITGLLSFASPSRAWLMALIMGSSVIVTAFFLRTIGARPVDPVGNPLGALIAFIPAGIGAVCGVGARSALRTAPTR